MATRQELSKKISLLLQRSDSLSLPELQQALRDVILGFGMLVIDLHPEGMTGEGGGPSPSPHAAFLGPIIAYAEGHTGNGGGPGPSDIYNRLIVGFAALVLAMQEPRLKKRKKRSK
jgi:hypothetical protein